MKITCRFKRTSIISGLLLSAGLVAPALPVFAAGSWIIDVNTRTFTKMEQEVMPIGINDHRGRVAGSNARGINNHGQVVALDNASVVPEPKIYAMILVGLGLVSFVVSPQDCLTCIYTHLSHGGTYLLEFYPFSCYADNLIPFWFL